MDMRWSTVIKLIIFWFVIGHSISSASYGKWIDKQSPYENDLLQYKKTIINGTSIAINNTGTIFFDNGKYLYKSDDGKSSILLYTFQNNITSIYYYNQTNNLFVSSDDGNIYRSIDNGKSWTIVLNISPWYPVYWSWDSDNSKILVGKYGNIPKTNDPIVWKSLDSGKTWKLFFDARNYYNITDNGSHMHLIKIDPYYNNRVFINVGDNLYYRGTYITEDNGLTFDQNPVVQYRNYTMSANGFLAAVFPDKDRTIFFSDNSPTIWEYNKNSKEIKKLAEMPNPYFETQVEFFDAIQGNDGVIYAASTEVDYKPNPSLSYIWLSIDGSTWYRLNSKFQNLYSGNYPLKYNPKDGYIYGKGIAFKDITKDQAAKLLYSPTNIVNISLDEDRNQYYNFGDASLENVKIVIQGKNFINTVSNPSFETDDPPTGWNVGDSQNSTFSQDCTTSRYDRCSGKISNSSWIINQYIFQNTKIKLAGNSTYIIRFSYKLNKSVNKRPILYIRYNNQTFNKNIMFEGVQYTKNWTDVIYYWTPSEDITITRISLYMYDQSATYWFDGIGISNTSNFVIGSVPSSNISLNANGTIIDIGSLNDGQIYTTTFQKLSGPIFVKYTVGERIYNFRISVLSNYSPRTYLAHTSIITIIAILIIGLLVYISKI